MNHKSLITAVLATAIATPIAYLNSPAIACLLVPNRQPKLSTNEAGHVTRIDNLVIPGYGTYTVTFHSGSYNDNFDHDHTPETTPEITTPETTPEITSENTPTPPTFYNNQEGARAAARAIQIALGTTQTIAESSTTEASDRFTIPYGIGRRHVHFEGDLIGTIDIDRGMDSNVPPSNADLNRDRPIGTAARALLFANNSWAKFTPAPTPQKKQAKK